MIKNLIGNVFTKHIKKKLDSWTIKEEDISDLLREIRINLLDSDVNLLVVKNFIKSIRTKCVGMIINQGEDPQQAILNVIKEELIKILGSTKKDVNFDNKLTKIMMVGLNGAGKTTTCGKLAYYLNNKLNKKSMLVGLDIYRPAAIEQLKKIADDNKIDFYENGTNNPVDTAKKALDLAEQNNDNAIIFDTAGRIQTNTELMNELVSWKKKINPQEIYLVVDAMSGQDIYNVAKEFDDTLNITGIIMTKVDTDAHAGAVLSLISLLNKNIVFMGDGEKISNLDIFYPERIADRILGLGDIMTLAEKAKESIDENVVKKSFARMMSGKMDFEDLYNCMNQINNMGSMGSIMKMMPNMPKINESQLEGGENKMKVWKIMMNSMTIKERRNPHILERESNRKIRIVKGSGRKMDELNKLISEWKKMKEKMEQVGKMIQKGKNPFGSFMK